VENRRKGEEDTAKKRRNWRPAEKVGEKFVAILERVSSRAERNFATAMTCTIRSANDFPREWYLCVRSVNFRDQN